MFSGQKYRRLTYRTGVISLAFIIVILVVLGGIIYWSFKHYAARNLENNLSAYVDILISSTQIDSNGGIYITDAVDSLENIPRYWQITAGTNKLRKNPNQKYWLPIDFTGSMDNKLRDVVDIDGEELTILQKGIRFPGGVWVNYIFGMPSRHANQILLQEAQNFGQFIGLGLFVTAVGLMMLSFFQVKLIMRPLNRVKTFIKDVKNGNADIEQQQFPDEIQPLADEIVGLAKHNSAVVERYRTFGENLSHGLKTPLSVIQNAAQEEAMGQMSGEQLSNIVNDKSKDMLNIINSNLARLRIAGKGNYFGKAIDISSISKKILKNLNRIYSEIKVVDYVEPYLRARIDEGDLFELLGNLIENAYKYTDSEVRLSSDSSSKSISIIIEDNGKGIAPSMIEEVQKRGTRLDEKVQGSGIGLPIAKEIVELYNGELLLEPSNLGGLKVVITLPR